jgi:branched-chain amino acid transport system substrate-binding protein
MNQIGILLPRSTYYETVGFDMFEGLRSGLKHAGRDDIKVFSENIGFGTDQQNCYRIVERLLMQENLTVVFAFISHRTAQLVRPLFMATNRVLVVLDSGANLPQEWPESPNIFFHSLHNSLGNMLIAQKAVRDGHRKLSIISGYYDGGYLHTHAGFLGATASGGEIVFNHATGYKREEFSMLPLKTFREQEPDHALLSVFSGDFVQWYFEELNTHFPGEQVPVYLAPFALEETTLKDAAFPGKNVSGVAAWSRELKNPENAAFIQSVEDAGWHPNLFSLLSWEAATLAIHLLDAMKEHKNNGKLAVQSLKDLRFDSPRGEIRFHATAQTTLAPLYAATLLETASGNCQLSITGEIATNEIEAAYEEMIAAPLDNATSGWYNSYTCI